MNPCVELLPGWDDMLSAREFSALLWTGCIPPEGVGRLVDHGLAEGVPRRARAMPVLVVFAPLPPRADQRRERLTMKGGPA